MDGSSRSAEHVALFRALEHTRPRDRLFADPLASRMLSRPYRLVVALSRLPLLHRALVRYIDTQYPGGPRASAVVRTRLIDDLVRAAVAAGAGQLVLLGAGFDNRAYRLAAPAVFEVDHPDTQATKRRRVPARFAARARFVPADLAVDDVRTVLLAAGFDPAMPTVVVWEGVTNYLTAEAVDATLRGLAGLLAPTSRIIFTYVDRAVLADIGAPLAATPGPTPAGTAASASASTPAAPAAPAAGTRAVAASDPAGFEASAAAGPSSGTFTGAAEWHEAVRRHGEPWTFGFDPADLPSYVAQRSLSLTLDMSARDAAARYLTPLGREEPTATFYRIAVADA